ncbi:MaoC family dehydratase [Thermodesulfobacteriota bacterium]
MEASFTYDEIEIGQEFSGPKVHVTREMIKEFAKASFDHNPLHLDDEFMEKTTFAGHKQFDDVIGHGLMTYSLMTRAMTDWLWPDSGDHRRLETRFRKPVYPGDNITVQGRVIDKRETRKGKWVVCEITVTNQRSEMVATGDALGQILS